MVGSFVLGAFLPLVGGLHARADPLSSPELVPFLGSFVITSTWGAPSGGYHAEADPAIDVAMPIDTPIFAAGAGDVISAVDDRRSCNPDFYSGGVYACIRDFPNSGVRVRIQHGDGRVSLYLHLNSIAPGISSSPQTRVSAGQLIGYSGNTGITTGPHLHYAEFLPDGTDIDPGDWTSCRDGSQYVYTGLQNRKSQTIRNDSFVCAIVPPTPVDSDGDGVPDASDRCPGLAGQVWAQGCPDGDGDGLWDAVGSQPMESGGDFDGDGKADFCRIVGATNPGFAQCTLSTGSAFGATITSAGLDRGYETGRAWVDFNGDGKTDYCRRVGIPDTAQYVSCTLSAGSAFGVTVQSSTLDWGYETGRAWVDFNGDGKTDFCRRVGVPDTAQYVSCTLSAGSAFGVTVQSSTLDWGYETGRAWVDFNVDAKLDFCRRVGAGTGGSQFIACTLSTGSGFGATVTSPALDWGYETGRAWVDFNGDNKADYCRRVGIPDTAQYVSCTLSGGTAFGVTVQSSTLDWGYETGRAWADFNGDGKADYCRRVGTPDTAQFVSCLLSAGSAFGVNIQSSTLDWGYDSGRSWVKPKPSVVVPPVAGAEFVGPVPGRLLDSRVGGSTVDGQQQGIGMRAEGSVFELVVGGRAGVPLDASGVVLNVTAVSPLGAGFVTVFPCGAATPVASNLNFRAGATVANTVVSRLGTGGRVCLVTSAASHLLVDVSGFFASGSSFASLTTPARLLDSRIGATTATGLNQGIGKRTKGSVFELLVTGSAGVASTASGAVLNVTAVNPAANGFFTVFPCGASQPVASSVNFAGGDVVANLVVTRIGIGGKVCLYTSELSDVIVDVSGYFNGTSGLVSLSAPARILDSRVGGSTVDSAHVGVGLRLADSTYTLPVAGRAGVAVGAKTVVLNVTVTGPATDGYVTVFPCDSPRPVTSSLNFKSGQTIANAVVSKVGAAGTLCIYTSASTHLLTDVSATLN
jgi:Peptidase family M23